MALTIRTARSAPGAFGAWHGNGVGLTAAGHQADAATGSQTGAYPSVAVIAASWISKS
jgi:hypothetical protein